MTTPLENLPEIRSYAATTDGTGSVNLTDSGSSYERLPEGVSTISISSKQADLTVYLSTGTAAASRYVIRDVKAGETVVLSGVPVPRGERRFMQIRAQSAGDVGVTIITYPL